MNVRFLNFARIYSSVCYHTGSSKTFHSGETLGMYFVYSPIDSLSLNYIKNWFL